MSDEIKSEADLLELGRLTAFGPVVVASGERDVWVCFPAGDQSVPRWCGLIPDEDEPGYVEFERHQQVLFDAANKGEVYVLYAPSRAGS